MQLIGFKVFQGKIQINLSNSAITFKTNNNILSNNSFENAITINNKNIGKNIRNNINSNKKENKNNKISSLNNFYNAGILNNNEFKILIKIFIYQEKIKSLSSHKFTNACMVKKEFIQKFKDYYNYKEFYNMLKQNNSFINNIMNNNSLTDINIEPILTNLNLQKAYINKINLEQPLIFNSDEKFIIYEKKLNEPNSKLLKYITNFEFIPSDARNYFLNAKYIDANKYIDGEFIISNKKIIIIFKENNNYFYEIGYIDNENLFNIEFIIDFNKSSGKNLLKNILDKTNINIFINDIYNQSRDNDIEKKYDIRLYNIQNIINTNKDNLNDDIIYIIISSLL